MHVGTCSLLLHVTFNWELESQHNCVTAECMVVIVLLCALDYEVMFPQTHHQLPLHVNYVPMTPRYKKQLITKGSRIWAHNWNDLNFEPEKALSPIGQVFKVAAQNNVIIKVNSYIGTISPSLGE